MTLKINSHRRKRKNDLKKKMEQQVGLPEDKIVAILYKVAREVAPKYKFGYHSKEDMIQHAVERGLDILNKGLFKPRSNTDLDKQLSAFMRVHMANRCRNLIRDTSCRYTNKDSALNQAKYNIMHPLYIYNQNLNEDFFIHEESDRNELHDCLDYIRMNLGEEQLADFDCVRDGGRKDKDGVFKKMKLSPTKQKKLMEVIRELFVEINDEGEANENN